MSEAYRDERQKVRDALAAQYGAQIKAIESERTHHLAVFKDRHKESEAVADALLQQREADREQQRALIASRITDWKKRQTAGHGDSLKSDAIARAIAKVKEKEQEEKNMQGRGRERGR